MTVIKKPKDAPPLFGEGTAIIFGVRRPPRNNTEKQECERTEKNSADLS